MYREKDYAATSAVSSSIALAAVAALGMGSFAFAGPFPADDGVPKNASYIQGWATVAYDLTRGPIDINDPAGDLASFGDASEALGPATAQVDGFVTTPVVSLGDGGSMTLGFAEPIRNGVGPDFAVFENALPFAGDFFLELGLVSVSSDGSQFFDFPAVSLTPTATQLGGFDPIDPTDLHNLAGKHLAGFGTPFDLEELVGTPGLDVNAITHVKITDVVGRIDAAPGNPSYVPTRDSLNNIINDPYATAFASGGIDIDGVAVLPEPGAALAVMGAGLLALRRRK